MNFSLIGGFRDTDLVTIFIIKSATIIDLQIVAIVDILLSFQRYVGGVSLLTNDILMAAGIDKPPLSNSNQSW